VGEWRDIRAAPTLLGPRPSKPTPTALFKINQLVKHLSGCSFERKSREIWGAGEDGVAHGLPYLTCDNDEKLVIYLIVS
jgi:hypothetical protein